MLSEIKIQTLEKKLDFAPIQKSINEPQLRKDLEDFSRRMRIRWNSRDFSDKPAFCPKSSWKPLPGHLGLGLLLSHLEREIFNCLLNDSISIPSNMSKEELEALRGLADDRSIVIKQGDKGSSVVVWCRDDYIKEAISNRKTKPYRKISTLKKQFFRIWLIKAMELLTVFTHANLLRRKSSNTFPTISKKQLTLANYIYYLKFISGDFIDKMQRIGKVPKHYFLVTADVVSLYPSVAHKVGTLALTLICIKLVPMNPSILFLATIFNQGKCQKTQVPCISPPF